MNLCSDKLNEYNKLSAIQKNLYCYLDEYKKKKIVLFYSGNYMILIYCLLRYVYLKISLA